MGFNERTLSDYAIIEMGQSPPGESCNSDGDGSPLLNGPTEFGNHHPIPVQWTIDPKRFAKKGDVLFCVRGSTTGRMNWADQNYAIGRGIAAIRPKGTPLTSHFIRALLELNLPELLAAATGSTFPNVSKQQLYALPCPLVKEEDQIVISNILSSLDDKIELNRRINKTLEGMAQAIFTSWFLDFDPVKAKMMASECGCDPERGAMAAIAGKLRVPAIAEELTEEDFTAAEAALGTLTREQQTELAETAALFPATFVDSELGLIPEGWGVVPFGSLLAKTIGGDWGKDIPDKVHSERVGIIRGTDIPSLKSGNLSTVPFRYVSPKKLAQRQLKAWDIIIEVSGGSKTQPTGRSLLITDGILQRLDHVIEPASFCRLFRPINDCTSLYLSIYMAIIYDAGKTWQYQVQSTGISNFQTPVFLEKERLILPTEKAMKVFFERIQPIINLMAQNENLILSTLRDTLLPKLLSGELSVDGIDPLPDTQNTE